MLPRINRLKGQSNFKYIYTHGQKIWTQGFLFLYANSQTPQTLSKFGIVTSKKVGGAVERNRARRLITTLLRPYLDKFPTNNNYIFVLNSQILTQVKENTVKDIEMLLSKIPM